MLTKITDDFWVDLSLVTIFMEREDQCGYDIRLGDVDMHLNNYKAQALKEKLEERNRNMVLIESKIFDFVDKLRDAISDELKS